MPLTCQTHPQADEAVCLIHIVSSKPLAHSSMSWTEKLLLAEHVHSARVQGGGVAPELTVTDTQGSCHLTIVPSDLSHAQEHNRDTPHSSSLAPTQLSWEASIPSTGLEGFLEEGSIQTLPVRRPLIGQRAQKNDPGRKIVDYQKQGDPKRPGWPTAT